MPKPSPKRDRTTNWSTCNAALRKRGALSLRLDPDMVRHAEHSGKRDGPRPFPNEEDRHIVRGAICSTNAIQTCLPLKGLFGLPLRQTVGLARSLIRMAGLDWPGPDHATPCRRQARIAVQIPYRASGPPPNLLIDNEALTAAASGRSDRWRDRWQLRGQCRMASGSAGKCKPACKIDPVAG